MVYRVAGLGGTVLYCTLYTVIDYIFPIIYDTVELEVVWLEYFKP